MQIVCVRSVGVTPFCFAPISRSLSVYSIYILIHARVPLQLVNKTRGIILKIYSMFRRQVVS